MVVEKYLLCRPQGGLNDMLCQIEKCFRYAQASKRILIIETDYHGSSYFSDSMSKYFVSCRSNLLLGAVEYIPDFDQLDVFPRFLYGRVSSYSVIWNKKYQYFYDDVIGEKITFDFSMDYNESLLVHHQLGGGSLSLWALSRLRVHEDVIEELLKRIKLISKPYAAIHIRNTDHETDYRQHLDHLNQTIQAPIFVATDNADTLRECKAVFGADRVYSFARRLSSTLGTPLHLNFVHGTEVTERNQDAILDLLMLALSSSLYIFQIKNCAYSKYSGFSRLAHSLNNSKLLLRHILSSNLSIERVVEV